MANSQGDKQKVRAILDAVKKEGRDSLTAPEGKLICDAYGIPLLFLQDVPGFMVGTKVEAAGIIRHGAKMLHAVAAATVPKVTVVLRKAYGAGYYVMCGKAYEPDLIVAWPGAEISVMGAEGAVNIIYRRDIAGSPTPEERRTVLMDDYKARFANPYIAAERGYIDDVIEPSQTRIKVAGALRVLRTKRVNLPKRKHGNIPL